MAEPVYDAVHPMLIESHGHKYSTVRASDLKRDGMGLELNRDGHVIAEVFYFDETGEFVISLFEQVIPLEIVERLIAEARTTLVPR